MSAEIWLFQNIKLVLSVERKYSWSFRLNRLQLIIQIKQLELKPLEEY